MKSIFVFAILVLLLAKCEVTLTQNFQLLSYANADLGQKLIRPTHTTPPSSPLSPSSALTGSFVVNHSTTTTTTTTPSPISTTTTKHSSAFFEGIRNIFSHRSGTISTTRRPTTTHRPTTHTPLSDVQLPMHVMQQHHHSPNIGSKIPTAVPSLRSDAVNRHQNLPSHNLANAQLDGSRIPVRIAAQHPTNQTSSTTKKSIEEFPPLVGSFRPNRIESSTSTRRTTTRHWHTSTSTRRPTHSLPTSKSSSSIISNGGVKSHQNPSEKNHPELATNEEMEQLSEILFSKTTPNIYPQINVNLQGRTRSSELNDVAPQPLLTLDPKILDSTETMTKMRALFDNYELDASVNENVSPIERQEENDLINSMLQTSVMREAMKFLQMKGVVTADTKTHFDLLKTIWFTLYSRIPGKVGSSAFEHVFMNEIKNNTIGGLHNWIWFYHKESEPGVKHSIDYQGYIKSLSLGTRGQYVKYRMNFDGIKKPVNALLIGTLPELEFALYTVCFEVNKSDCPISLGGTKLRLRSFPYRYRGKRLIGSIFPE